MTTEETESDMENCKLCGVKTKSIVNISFKATPVCNNCCNSILLQQAKWLVDEDKTKDN